MGDVVNLRLARKRRNRAEAEEVAAANRARHGRTLQQKRSEADEAQRHRNHLDAHRREREPDRD